eukprot:6210847-Pleurochrysis_carterae.AAC.2
MFKPDLQVEHSDGTCRRVFPTVYTHDSRGAAALYVCETTAEKTIKPAQNNEIPTAAYSSAYCPHSHRQACYSNVLVTWHDNLPHSFPTPKHLTCNRHTPPVSRFRQRRFGRSADGDFLATSDSSTSANLRVRLRARLRVFLFGFSRDALSSPSLFRHTAPRAPRACALP